MHAIREGCLRRGCPSLKGCTMYTSTVPCPSTKPYLKARTRPFTMLTSCNGLTACRLKNISSAVCTGAIYWSRIDKVFYGASNEDVSRAKAFETDVNVFEGDEYKKSPQDRTLVPFVSSIYCTCHGQPPLWLLICSWPWYCIFTDLTSQDEKRLARMHKIILSTNLMQ